MSSSRTGLEIAVVGMAGRFPGAPGVDELWRLLADGREGITFFSGDELADAGVPAAQRADPAYVPARGALDGTDLFDADFFGISPREAEVIDPQHRLFLETAWAALENAGYDPGTCSGSIGVYAGSSLRSHTVRVLGDRELLAGVGAFPAHLGVDKDFLATRAAYKLGLRGPALTVQTACSTSLVAVHVACRSLLGGECSMALAGGVSASAEERGGHRYDPGGIVSPDGHCRAFDARSAGTVNGSGVGVVVLKRLEDALADGDTIHAVVRGTAVNNDGAGKVGFTAPSVEGQARAIADALAFAEVDAATVGYVEAHGTGTALGDPIEVTALADAFRAHTGAAGFCALGAVKSNLGHLDAASGIAGFIKATLALRHGMIPATLHFTAPNPALPLQGSPFFVSDRLQPWKVLGVRRAGVSSFGVGGTNAHAVLEQAPEPEPSGPSRPWQLLTISARTPAALGEARANLAAHLRAHPEQALADVAHTLRAGRAPFRHRLAIVCATAAEAASALEDAAHPAARTGEAAAGSAPVAFLFPAGPVQAQTVAALYAGEAAFRAEVDRCAELLRQDGLDLRDALFGAAGDGLAAAEPAAFMAGYALAKVWIGWGIVPGAVLGRGAGGLAAAAVAGVFSPQDALRLAVARGKGAGAFADAVRRVRPAVPSLRMVSGATGGWMTPAEAADPAYWARAEEPAMVAEGVRTLLAEPRCVLLELGPGSLAARVGEIAPERAAVASLAAAGGDDARALAEAARALWLAGARPDWAAFVADERRRRVPLPTYPFERRSFWLPPRRPEQGAPARPARARTGGAADSLHRPVWTPAPAPGAAAAGAGGGWVLLEDEGGVGARVAARLESSGCRVVRVRPGPMLERTAADAWTLRPGSTEDFLALVDGLGGPEFGHFVHLWSLDAPEAGEAADILGRERARGADTLLALAGALAARGDGSARVTAATAGVHEVSGEEALLPARATAAAALRMMREAGVAARHVDFGTDVGPRAAARRAEQLLAELPGAEDADAVAYRGRLRFIREWDAPAAEEGVAPATLREDGVYLVTGGLTPAGLAVAGALARRGARLALLGGLPVPPREMWEMAVEACAHATGPIDQVRALEEAGAEVAFSSADPGDLGALRIFASTVRSRWGRIDGVIHCAAAATAGDARHAPASTDPLDLLSTVSAGAHALRVAFRDQPLDFCLLLSDDDADGAAAEAYLGTFCEAQARESAVPWISARMAPVRTSPEGEGTGPAVFVDTLRAILAAPAPHVVVSATAPAARAAPARAVPVEEAAAEETAALADPVMEAASAAPDAVPPPPADQPAALRQSAAAAPAGGADGRRVLTTYAAPRNDVETHVAALWQELLGVGTVGIHDDFFEMGGHSLLGIRVLSRLRTELAVDLPPEMLFMAPTVAQLSEVVEAVLTEELDGLSDDDLRALADA